MTINNKLPLSQWAKDYSLPAITVTLSVIGSIFVLVLPPAYSLLLGVLLIGAFLTLLVIISGQTRRVAIVFILVLLPLTGILKAITGSRYAPLVFDLGLLLACGIHLIEGLSNGKLRLGKLDILLLVLWGLALLQIFNPNVPGMLAGIEGFRKFMMMSIAFYISRHILHVLEWRLFRNGMIIFSIPVTLYGIKQFFLMSPIDYRMIELATASPITFRMGGWIRPFSTMPGPFHLGLYVMIVSLLLLILVMRRQTSFWLRPLLVILLVAQIVLLLMTRTKGTWGGFAIGVIVLILIQSKNPLRAIIRLAVFALVGGVIVYTVVSLTSGTTLKVINDAIFAITHPSQAPTFIFRLDLWQNSVFPAIQEQFFLGYGTSSAGEGLQNLYENTNSQHFPSHNLYLKVLVELGFWGLVLFLWIVGKSLLTGWRWLRKPIKLQQEVLMTMQWGVAVVIAFLVSGLVIPTLDAYPTNYYFWFLLGLLSRTKSLEAGL